MSEQTLANSSGAAPAGFTSDECNLFAEALEMAWAHLTETGQAGDETLIKAALSRAILQAGEQGERNRQLLVAYALAHLQ